MFPWKVEKELSPQERVIRDKLAEIERRGEGTVAVQQAAFKVPLLPVSRSLVSGASFGGNQGSQGLSSEMFGGARNEEQRYASGAGGRPGEKPQQQQRGSSSSNFGPNFRITRELGNASREFSAPDERYKGGPGLDPGVTRNNRDIPNRGQLSANQGSANRGTDNKTGSAGGSRPVNRAPSAGGSAALGQKNASSSPLQNLQSSAATAAVKETKLSEKDEKDLKEAIDVMCTVHVRFIGLSTREDAIRRLFVPFGPVIGCKLQQDPKPDEYGKMTKFAHVRFVVPEAASLAIEQTNNVKLEGNTIRVTRPTVDTKGPRLQPIIVKLLSEAMLCHRVYVSSIDASVHEEQLRSLFAKFGKLLSISLAQDPNDRHRHRGFGYVEFDTLKAKDAAMTSMNNYNFSGKQLRVGMAVTPPRITEMCLPSPKKSASDYVKEFQSGAYQPVEQPQKVTKHHQQSSQKPQQPSQRPKQHFQQQQQQSQSQRSSQQSQRSDRGTRQQTTDRASVANYSGLLPSADTIGNMDFESVIRLTSELLGPDFCPRLDGINDSDSGSAAGSLYVPAAQAEIASVADEYRELEPIGVRFLPNRVSVFDQIGISTDPLAVDEDFNLLSSLSAGGGSVSGITELNPRDLVTWERALRVNVGIMSVQDVLLAGVLKVFQQIPASRATSFVGEGLIAMVDSVADSMRSSARMLQNVIFARRDAYVDGSAKESRAELRSLPVQGSHLFNGEVARIVAARKLARGRPQGAMQQHDRRNNERRSGQEEQGTFWRGGDDTELNQGDYRMRQRGGFAGVGRRDRSPPSNRRRSRSPLGRMAPRSRSPFQRMMGTGRPFSTRDGRY